MFKNVATKVEFFAFDTTTGKAKIGDAANITAYLSKDYAAPVALTDTSATEQDATKAPGVYLFDVSQAETNANALSFTAVSTTANVSLVPVYVFTVPASFPDAVLSYLDIAVSSRLAAGSYSAAPSAAANATAVWAKVLEGPYTAGDELRLVAAAAAAGILSGAATTTTTIRDLSNTKNRIVAAVDTNGNRISFSTIDGT